MHAGKFTPQWVSSSCLQSAEVCAGDLHYVPDQLSPACRLLLLPWDSSSGDAEAGAISDRNGDRAGEAATVASCRPPAAERLGLDLGWTPGVACVPEPPGEAYSGCAVPEGGIARVDWPSGSAGTGAEFLGCLLMTESVIVGKRRTDTS